MKALIILADGFSEEAFVFLQALRKAGVDTTTASVSSSIVSSAEGVKVMVDRRLAEMDTAAYEMIILPGGPGYRALAQSSLVRNAVKSFNSRSKIIAASGEAPVILAELGVLDGKVATVFPGYEKQLPRPREARVVVAKNVITSRGPATAMDMALKLVEVAAGKPAAAKIRRQMAVDADD